MERLREKNSNVPIASFRPHSFNPSTHSLQPPSISRVSKMDETTQLLRWVGGVDDGVQRRAGHPLPGTLWYVLPADWLRLLPTGAIPQVDNSALIECYSHPLLDAVYTQLKQGLRENEQYRLVPEKAWVNIVEKYGVKDGSTVKRESRTTEGHKTTVELRLIEVEVCFVSVPLQISALRTALVSAYDSLYSLKIRLRTAFLRDFPSDEPLSLRLWKPYSSAEELEQTLLRSLNSQEKVFPGDLLTDDQRFCDANITLLIAEVMERGTAWQFCQLADAFFCEEGCRSGHHRCDKYFPPECQCCHTSITSHSFTCPCQSFEYCDENCYRQDVHECEESDCRKTCRACRVMLPISPVFCGCAKVRSRQERFCSFACAQTHGCPANPSSCHHCGRSLPSAPVVCHCKSPLSFCSSLCLIASAHRCSLSEVLVRVGLRNMGNTCYLNSALQCLVHTSFLRKAVLLGDYEKDVNQDNDMGAGGRLIGAFGKLVRKLARGSRNCVTPTVMKREIETFAKQFTGDDQHDSQELLSIVLDGLHEDLNRVRDKPQTNEPANQVDEQTLAVSSWDQHLARNSSLIVENMHGQYRSIVHCPKCGKTSTSFDPFLMLSVDIPPPLLQVEVVVVPSDFAARATTFVYALPADSSVSTVITRLQDSLPVLSFTVLELDTPSLSLQSLELSSTLLDSESSRVYLAYADDNCDEDLISVVVSVLKEDRSCGYLRTLLCTYPRVLRLPGEITLEKVHYRVFEALKPMIRLREQETEEMEVEQSAEDALQTLYQKLYEEKSSNLRLLRSAEVLYSLRAFNYNRHWNYCRAGSDACPYCHTVHFANCALPFSSVTLGEYVREGRAMLQLEAVCPQGMCVSEGESEEHETAAAERKRLAMDRTSASTLEECLEYTCREKTLSGDNLWRCEGCKDHVAGRKRMTIHRQPQTLIIHLKRFHQCGQQVTKCEKRIDFPLSGLSLSQYCDTPDTRRYSLYAVNQHRGSLAFGHYTAVCRDESGWALFDDSVVTPIPSEEVVSQDAYVLFYEEDNS